MCDSTLSLLSSAKAGGGNSSSERAEARDGTLSSSAKAGGGKILLLNGLRHVKALFHHRQRQVVAILRLHEHRHV